MDDQTLEVLERFWLTASVLRKLAQRTLKVAANLSPSDRKEILKAAAMLEIFTQRLRDLAAATGASLAELRSGVEESTKNFSSTIETLGRIVLRTDDPDQPIN
ncbi:MAG TPA: hypothetical protein VGQ28_01275 [Thermoanaerobaculia bacterium]|jgi:hypothetical protein|nr:hypothetical protein [Thermoanaerobaculia bacterium]